MSSDQDFENVLQPLDDLQPGSVAQARYFYPTLLLLCLLQRHWKASSHGKSMLISNLREIVRSGPWGCIFYIIITRHVLSGNCDFVFGISRE